MIATALLGQVAWSEILIGLLVALGTSLVGPARYARWVRLHVAIGFRHHEVATWIGLVVLVLAVLVWSPFSASGNWVTILIVLALAVIGVEALRTTSAAEDEERRAEEASAMALTSDKEEDGDRDRCRLEWHRGVGRGRGHRDHHGTPRILRSPYP